MFNVLLHFKFIISSASHIWLLLGITPSVKHVKAVYPHIICFMSWCVGTIIKCTWFTDDSTNQSKDPIHFLVCVVPTAQTLSSSWLVLLHGALSHGADVILYYRCGLVGSGGIYSGCKELSKHNPPCLGLSYVPCECYDSPDIRWIVWIYIGCLNVRISIYASLVCCLIM